MKLGNVIYKLRKEAGIKQQDLSNGYCSVSTISKIENGQLRPDCFLANALLERLGKYSARYYTLMSNKEYEFYLFQNKVFDAINNNNFAKVKNLITDFIYIKDININIQEQFLCMVEGIIENNPIEKIRYLEMSLWLNNYNRDELPNHYLSEREHVITCLLCEAYYSTGRQEEAITILSEIIKNTTKMKIDNAQLALILPREEFLLCTFLQKKEEYEKIFLHTEKVINLLKEEYHFFYMEEMLKLNLEARKQLGFEDTGHQIESELEALHFIISEFNGHNKIQKNSKYGSNVKNGILLMDEHISSSRKRLGLSQEQLCEGICSSVTMSRIECGTQIPSDKHFKMLTEKFGNHSDYYYGNIFTDDFETLEMSWQIVFHDFKNNHVEAVTLFNELENKIDKTIPENRQFIGLWKTILKKEADKEDILELIKLTK